MLRSLFQNSSIYLLGDLIRRSISLFLLPFYTRYLSPSDYGLLELLDLVITVTVLLFGLSAAGTSMVRIYHDKNNERERAAVVSTVLWLVLVVGAATSVGGIASAAYLSRMLFHGENAGLIQVSFFAMCFGSVVEILMLYQQLKRRPIAFVVASMAQTLAMIGFNIYFIGIRHMGVWGFVLSKLIVLSVAAVILIAATIREVSWRFHLKTAHEIVQFGSPLIVSSLAIFTIHFSDRFFINRYANLSDLGLYALAYKLGMLVSVFVGGPFSAVWDATFYGELKISSWRSQFARTLLYLTLLVAFAAVGISVFARPVLRIAVTSGYFGAIALVPIIAGSYAVRTIGDFFRNILFIRKKSRLFGGLSAACAAANLSLNALLIPRFGIYGAAWATAITWSAYLCVCCTWAQRTNPLPVRWRSLVLTFSAMSVVLVANHFTSFASPIGQWLFALTACVMFLGALLWCGAIPAIEREALLRYSAPMRGTVKSVFGMSAIRAR